MHLLLSDTDHLSILQDHLWSTRFCCQSCDIFTELLDQHKKFLICPVEVIPCLKFYSNSPPTCNISWNLPEATTRVPDIVTI